MKNPIKQTLYFSRNDVHLTSTPSGLKIDLQGCKSMGVPGSPAFPGKIIRVALPKNKRATEVTELIARNASLTRKLELVTCIQEPQFFYLEEDEVISNKTTFHKPNIEQYETIMKDPLPVVKLLKTEWVDDLPMAVLQVIPVRYLKNGTIELAEIIELSIAVEDFKRENPVPPKIRKKRLRDLGKIHRMVANRAFVEGLTFHVDIGDLPLFEIPDSGIDVPDDVDYLILTDNYKWDAENMTPGDHVGDNFTEFQRLATWKRQRGLRTHVAKITDIVNGGYGDYKTGARDLQEVIRNFLKDFCAAKGTEWVLLGGDVGIIPVRKVRGSAACRIKKGEPSDNPSKGSTPDGELSGDNTIAWLGSFLGMRVELNKSDKPVYGQPDHILTNFETGEIIPFDSTGATKTNGNLGWYFCSDDSFDTRETDQTQWIRINGPKSRINNTMVWYRDDNTIPTDLYYSSLWSPLYNQPGKHDWDLLDNGLYGQHKWDDPHMDGVDFIADIGLARAPVETPDEATVIVNKIIEYEQWDQDATNTLERFRKMLFVSANWGHYTRIKKEAGNGNPPGDHRYHSNAAAGYALINTKDPVAESDQKLICVVNDTTRKVMDYNDNADASSPGWYYAKSETDLSPSYELVDLWIIKIKIPIPTKWIVYYGANNAEVSPMYFALDKVGPDSSMTEQETLRKWMKSNYYKIDQIQRLYTDETDLDPGDFSDASLRHLTAENLEFALDEGPHFVSLSGHGNSNWVAYLQTELVNRTVNGSNTSIMYADSCSTNRFDDNDAVGESALKHDDGGAVAYIGNSRYSWVGVGDDFRLEFFKTMQYSRHLADLNDSRCYFANQNNIYHLWVIFALHANGDPEMPVYRDLDDAKPRYIGNRNTLELHRNTCQWVEKMAYFNMIAYDSIQQGLNAGHDGCYYCLNQHHTK